MRIRNDLTCIGPASAAINRVKQLTPNLFATGDDDGVVKVCAEPALAKVLHLTALFSSGTLDKRTLPAPIPIILILYPIFCGLRTRNTSYARGGCFARPEVSIPLNLSIYSGDGTLSVLDVRSKKTAPFAHSEDQEDELLSIVAIKGCVR